MTKKDNEDFKDFDKCWICDINYVKGNVEVRDYCHITGRYRCSLYIDCNMNVKLNHEISIALRNLKSYDSHLITQELIKFNFKVNVAPNELEKYMSFNISNNSIFIDSF